MGFIARLKEDYNRAKKYNQELRKERKRIKKLQFFSSQKLKEGINEFLWEIENINIEPGMIVNDNLMIVELLYNMGETGNYVIITTQRTGE